MSTIKLLPLILLAAALLLATPARAQSRPAPEASATTDVTVRMAVPTTLVALRDYTGILLSRDQDKLEALVNRRHRKTVAPVVTFSVALPKSWVKKLTSE